MKTNCILPVTIILIFSFLPVSPAMAQVEYVAHRGASFLAPENTLASAKLAWELGVDAVELDCYKSSDNKLVVIHDGSTKRTSGKDYKVKETSSEILRGLDVGSYKDLKYQGEKIPYLEEEIALIPQGKKLVIELKMQGEILPEVEKVVKSSGKQDQLIFICFDRQTILDTKKVFPAIPCYWLSANKADLVKNIRSVADNGLEGIDLHYSIVDEEVMALAKGLNLEVYAWTVDDPAEAGRLIKCGVKSITSNRPDWLKEQVRLLAEQGKK
jgi:glycerophosphoryl diester phosphodiesterase